MKLRVAILLFITPMFSFAQDSTFLSHAETNLSKQAATEKVYLHLDKPNYTFGDTIWYKAYTVVGSHHQLSALSGVLYVELIAPTDTIVTRQILHLTAGVTWGDMPLPHKLKQGVYRVRAYTNWMRNAGPDYFYDQKIRLGGIPPSASAQQNAAINPDVQFFPEGGELVNGVRSRVAVKAVGTNGMGVDIKGTIEDNNGNVITDFATRHLGMGELAFTPQSGKTYQAKINSTGETAFTINLPPAKDEGYTLALNNSQKDSIYIKIAVNDKTFSSQKNSTFYLLAQSNGKVYYTTQGKLEDLVYSAKVDKSRFPTGIAQFTLFAQNGEPLAERIAYIESNDTLQVHITTQSANNTTRQNVKINLQVKDHNNKPITGSFSAAVINESMADVDETEESTIMNNLLLTSDLKGNIEQPNYYFINPDDKTRADLDILMLTQGYRRLEWKQVLNDTSKTIKYMPEQSLSIAGTLKTQGGKPVPNGKITLMANKENIIRDTTADVNGNFKFAGLYLSDTTIVILRARKENNGSNVSFQVIKPGYPAITKRESDNTPSPQSIALQQKAYTAFQQFKLQDSLKYGRQLKQVNVKSYRVKKPDLSNSTNLNGAGNANQVIMGKDLKACINLSDCLDGKIFGVVFKNGIPFSIRASASFHPHAMAVIIDGNVTPGQDKIMDNLNPNDVYSIEVLRSGSLLAIYGTDAGGGALIITTKRGSEDVSVARSDPRGIITYPFIGYTKTRRFYVPKYTVRQTDRPKEDSQSTIFWKPNILTDKDGNASFEYNNNDTKGTYRIVIEGIDDDGDLGRQVYKYEVK